MAAPSSFASAPRLLGPRREPRDLPISATQVWDNVQLVRSALVSLEQGQFNQAAMMLDAMLGDSHIAAKLDDRLGGLFGASFTMAPPAGLEEDSKALDAAEDALALWPELTADRAERAIMRDGLMLGAGLGEIVVEPLDGEWRLRLNHWHARWLTWRWDTRTYWVSTMHGMEELVPDGAGGYYSTWRANDGQEQVSRWMLYLPYGYQRGWVNARIKCVAVPWLLRMWAFRDWGRHSEVLGIPPKKVTVPSEWDDEEKRRALSEIAALASEGVIMVPKKPDGTGFDVELLEVKGPNGKDTFDGLIERAEASITVALVGQTLTTQASSNGGNRALGQVHERVQDKLRSEDAHSFGDSARACILRPWALWNLGDAELAPVPTWQIDPPEDLKSLGEGMDAIGKGIASLKQAGIPVDRAKICADASIPLEDGVDFEDPEPPQTPPGTPGQEHDEPDEDDDGGPSDQDEDDDPEQTSRVELARKRRASAQGQVYADQLADHGRAFAARLLAGDVRAIRRVVEGLAPTPDGGIDVHALRQRLVQAYRAMSPDKLARLTEKCLILAELSGRYAVQKEI